MEARVEAETEVDETEVVETEAAATEVAQVALAEAERTERCHLRIAGSSRMIQSRCVRL